MKRKQSNRRQHHRRIHTRRRTDIYYAIGRFAGLIGFPCAAIVGQAELIGEPWRHYVTIIAIVGAVVWAYGTKPDFLSTLKTLLNKSKAVL